MKHHELKIWPVFFEAIFVGHKKCEFRINDRDFQVGDLLILREYHPQTESFTGREIHKYVSHMLELLDFSPGYVILSLSDFPLDAFSFTGAQHEAEY
jgi:hypothetical protein